MLDIAQQRGEMLAQFLNVTKGSSKQNRVFRVLKCCQELEPLRWKEPLSVEIVESPEKIGREVRKAQLQKTINQALRKCRFLLYVRVDYRFNVSWLPARPTKLTKAEISRYRESGNQVGKLPIGEMGAIQFVLEMATAGTVGRIRQCRCGKWFMAKTNKKVVCSGTCRFKKYQEKESFKEHRREYMRNYTRNPKVRAKRSQGRTSKQKGTR